MATISWLLKSGFQQMVQVKVLTGVLTTNIYVRNFKEDQPVVAAAILALIHTGHIAETSTTLI